LLHSLALRGRLVEIAATGGREVCFDLADFYHNESRLYGVDTAHSSADAAFADATGSVDCFTGAPPKLTQFDSFRFLT